MQKTTWKSTHSKTPRKIEFDFKNDGPIEKST